MIDYVPYFQFMLASSQLIGSLKDKNQFVESFYQFYISGESYPFQCKLFNETVFIIDLSNEMGQQIFRYGYIEPDVTNFLSKNVQPGDGFIDCGAHMGYYSKLASLLVGSEGFVIALEPNPDILPIFKLNNGDSKNVHLINKAISRDGQIQKLRIFDRRFSPYNTVKEESRIISCIKIDPLKVIDVESITLSEIINELRQRVVRDKNIWIKLDIEGLELDVISASIESIIHEECKIIFEGDFDSKNNDKIISIFLENDYRVNLLDKFTTIPVSIPLDIPKNQTFNFLAFKN